jgi:mRNA-degrading endonuclease RelE of RelBE toxin-antitoxin system
MSSISGDGRSGRKVPNVPLGAPRRAQAPGKPARRLPHRAGDYRVVYEIDDKQKVVRIMRVRHRREVYR